VRRGLPALLTLLGVMAGCLAAKRPPPAPPRISKLGLSFQTRTLANGMSVVIVRDPGAAEVQVTMRYAIGSVDDGPHPGLAHLVEHLMFQQELDGQPLFTHLEDAASYFNAATTFDATTYVARAPVSQLGKLVAIETTRLEKRCQTISDATFVREREVVVHELEQTDQTSQVFAALDGALYPQGHPYRVPIGGSVDTVSAITKEQACSFIEAHYAPGNAALVISGNLVDADIDAVLAQAAAVAKRNFVGARSVEPAPQRSEQLETPAPIDEDVLVLAWPLPVEPDLQAKVRAIAGALPRLVDAEIKGAVIGIELGDARAPMIGLAVVPADDETFQQAVDGTRRGIEKLPGVFAASNDPQQIDRVLFERLKMSAVYNVYSSLDDGSDRDARLATYLLAGRDPAEALDKELGALRSLSREEGGTLAANYLGANAPTVVTLKAGQGRRRGTSVTLRAPLHDMGQRRTPPDPGLAHHAADRIGQENLGVHSRRLPNGLEVVLVPLSTVPTFDARLVFRTGTADEPANQRGVALIAANTLTWDLHYLRDLLPFVSAGGLRDTDVGTDRTTFAVQGLDMNLDVILAGLRRWVRDGTYDDSAVNFVTAMRRATKRVDDQGVLTDAWRAALFGGAHPYVAAGIARLASNTLTLDDAAKFRATHYTPDNATLVITGHFDPLLADKWIDYLFADWKGRADSRQSMATAARPTTLARVDDTALVQLRIALQTTADRAHAIVAAELLDDIVHDVRYRFGASYTLDAQLAETRLASFYLISGWIDSARAAVAMKMIRDRIAELHSDATAAARAFVIARRHALTHLEGKVTSASALAARVEHDIEMQRAPLSDLSTAKAVQALTIDDMGPTLGELDLAQATVLLSGPQAELKTAFDVLGRKPTFIDSPKPDTAAAGPSASPPAFTAEEQHVRVGDLEPSLTFQPPPPRFLELSLGYMRWGSVGNGVDFGGLQLAGGIGYRWYPGIKASATLAIAKMETASSDPTMAYSPALLPIDLRGGLRFESSQGFLGLHGGLHLDELDGTWRTMPAYALEYGISRTWGNNDVGILIRWEATFMSEDSYRGLSFHLLYRR
jgi:zinc protease